MRPQGVTQRRSPMAAPAAFVRDLITPTAHIVPLAANAAVAARAGSDDQDGAIPPPKAPSQAVCASVSTDSDAKGCGRDRNDREHDVWPAPAAPIPTWSRAKSCVAELCRRHRFAGGGKNGVPDQVGISRTLARPPVPSPAKRRAASRKRALHFVPPPSRPRNKGSFMVNRVPIPFATSGCRVAGSMPLNIQFVKRQSSTQSVVLIASARRGAEYH